uniref:Uncharacterized protein n=1 Tax=Oryza sativa subsp. japonica TaxID=39947 RepID=Q6ZGZ6_ORYSJ|nr:hypothetical protein [Oryza sativa Japonica Group]
MARSQYVLQKHIFRPRNKRVGSAATTRASNDETAGRRYGSSHACISISMDQTDANWESGWWCGVRVLVHDST